MSNRQRHALFEWAHPPRKRRWYAVLRASSSLRQKHAQILLPSMRPSLANESEYCRKCLREQADQETINVVEQRTREWEGFDLLVE